MGVLGLLFLFGAACGSTGTAATSGTRSSVRSHGARAALTDDRPLATAGARCTGAACQCREVDARGYTVGEGTNEGAIAEGHKRFEFRTARGSDDVQITVEGRGTLHKTSDVVASTCGYVDLPPGEHRVRLRVKAGAGEGGTSPRILIFEHSAPQKSWYGTFSLACNDAGACTRADMEDRVRELGKAHGLFDPCGSTKVTDIHWEADKAPDERVTSLDLELTLKVYKFSPRFPRGGTCKGLTSE